MVERRRIIFPFWRPGRVAPPPPDVGERGRNRLYINRFDLPPEVKAGLSAKEAELLDLLVKAAEGIEPAFATQATGDERGNFYPPDASKEEILEAAENNPAILSPYTTVRRAEDGHLTAVPTTQIYQDLLGQQGGVIDNLRKAAKVANSMRDFEQDASLRVRAQALEKGDLETFEMSERFALESEKEPKIGGVNSLYDTYTDRFLGLKFAFEAWVGVLDPERTLESQLFVSSLLDWYQEETGQVSPKIKLRVEHTVVQSGQAALYDWSANSLPCQREWRQQYGSRFYVFWPQFNDKFKQAILPDFRTFIHPNHTQVSDKVVETAALRKLIGHEVSHSLGVADDLENRLQGEASWVKELYCDLLALKGYSEIPAVNIDEEADLKERETAIGAYFAGGIRDLSVYQATEARRDYHIASSIVYNYCLGEKSIRKIKGQITWKSRAVVTDTLAQLFAKVDQLQRNGSFEDACVFRELYFNSARGFRSFLN